MSVTRSLIFIASNFQEFGQLRQRLLTRIATSGLPLEAVDLNQNEPSDRSALEHSLLSLRRCEVMVLFVGELYGGTPPGEELGYTHQEYRLATEEGSGIRILPFFIGPSYHKKLVNFSGDPPLAAWQREILANHTASFFTGTEDPEELVAFISRSVEKVIFERLSDAEQSKIDLAEARDDTELTQPGGKGDAERLDFGALSEDEKELDALEGKYVGQSESIFLDRTATEPSQVELLSRPAETAAREQRGEADKAMALGDREAAIHHLRRAIDHRMLDWDATYRLARLLVQSGRRKDCDEALRLALRAERMARYDGRDVAQTYSLLLAAQAAARQDDLDAALSYARQAANDVTPWFARAVAELACQHALRDEWDDAFHQAKRAFFRFPPVLVRLNREPAFQRHPSKFREFKRTLRLEVRDRVGRLLQMELLGYQRLPPATPEVDPAARQQAIQTMALLDLVAEGRESGRRALAHLRKRAKSLLERAEPLLKNKVLPDTSEGVRTALEKARQMLATTRPAEEQPPPPNPMFAVGYVAGVLALLVGWVLAVLPALPAGLAMLALGLVLTVGTGIAHGVSADQLHQNERQRQAAYSQRLRDWEAVQAGGPLLIEMLGLFRAFTEQARDYEREVTAWQLFSPRGGLKRAKARTLVRLGRGDALPKAWTVDHALLPPRLQQLEPILVERLPGEGTVPQGEGTNELVRVLDRTEAGGKAARWASYFEPQ